LADAIGRLTADADLRQRLAVAAQKRVAEDFDGSALAGRMAELLVAR
jgi:hypothetical protein